MPKTNAAAARKPKAAQAAPARPAKAAAPASAPVKGKTKKVLIEVSAALAAELIKAKKAKRVARESAEGVAPTNWIDKYFGIWADEPQDLDKLREAQWVRQ